MTGIRGPVEEIEFVPSWRWRRLMIRCRELGTCELTVFLKDGEPTRIERGIVREYIDGSPLDKSEAL